MTLGPQFGSAVPCRCSSDPPDYPNRALSFPIYAKKNLHTKQKKSHHLHKPNSPFTLAQLFTFPIFCAPQDQA